LTQHYLAGELSLLLQELQTAANESSAGAAAALRREVETVPLSALPWVMARALELSDGLCWDSLSRGDVAAFSAEAAICGELHVFGVCAGLLEEG
jgi:hypothetical protein